MTGPPEGEQADGQHCIQQREPWGCARGRGQGGEVGERGGGATCRLTELFQGPTGCLGQRPRRPGLEVLAC